MKALAHSKFNTFLVLTFFFAIDAVGQTATTGSIVVRVKDSTSAPVANVILSIAGPNLIRSQSATTNRDGYVRIYYLPPGRYNVTAIIARAFVTSEKQTVDVSISRTSSVTFLVHWRPEARRLQVRNQRRDTPPRPPSRTSLEAQRTATNISHDSKPSGNLPVAPNSAKSSTEATAHYKRAVGYAQAKLFNEAVISFKDAIHLKSDYADAYYGLGQAYFDLGRWTEAIDALDRAIKIDPRDRSVYMKLGESYARLRAEGKAADAGELATGKNVGAVEPASATDNVGSRPALRTDELTQVYRVGVGDVLDIRINNTPIDRSTVFTVTSHGLLEHPLITRPLNVSGLTTDEISTRIETELKSKAINERPDVLVAVREFVSHTIIVSGLVKNPGTKILRREAIPLYVILADAQPVAEVAEDGRASVISKETGEITTVDLSDSTALSLAVRAGDVVNVQVTPKQYFYIGGEVKAPGEKSFRPGITLTQAILAAGGLSGKAATVQLARESKNGRLAVTRYKLDDINMGKLPDPVLQQGDRITVPH